MYENTFSHFHGAFNTSGQRLPDSVNQNQM